MNPYNTEQITFEVHPSVIFKLGEDLITDDYQALVELIKNSYDADAEGANVKIYTDKYYKVTESGATEISVPESEDNKSELLRGMIEIQDNGSGMSVEDIRRGWLTISASQKRAMKAEGRTTDVGRTPLGDKGLGRLGAQRLGKLLCMQTKKIDDENGNEVSIDWSRFTEEKNLSEIPISVTQSQTDFQKGTIIRIYGIPNVEQWKRAKEIQDRFIDIISPYSADMGFKVSIFVDDVPIDLHEKSDEILRNSAVTYNLSFDGTKLSVGGYFNPRYLADLRVNKNVQEWNELIGDDNGKLFIEWVLEKERKKALSFAIEKHDDKLCHFSFSINADDVPDVERDNAGGFYNPGQFSGRVYDITRDDVKSEFKKRTEYKQWINSAKGIRVYRDGFGIKLQKDWIGLATQWTSAKSYYTLQPENTIGYFNISAGENKHLVETTNREEFQDNAYYRNLQRILAQWLNMTEDLQALLRRGYNDYRKVKLAEAAQIPEALSYRNIVDDIKETIDEIEESAHDNTLFQQDNTKQAIQRLEEKKSAIELLATRVDESEEQIKDAWDLIALGIMAETISHEIYNISNRLEEHSRVAEKYNREKYQDSTISQYTDLVRSSSRALKKQISHLDSSLRFVRESKDTFNVSELLKSSIECSKTRLEQRNIKISMEVEEDFVIWQCRQNSAHFDQRKDQRCRTDTTQMNIKI